MKPFDPVRRAKSDDGMAAIVAGAVVAAALALVLYFGLHLSADRAFVPLAEPWVTLVYMVIGIATALMSERCRQAAGRRRRRKPGRRGGGEGRG